MPSNFAVRFQTKYPNLGEAWRQFARGEVPETFPPEWRGVNYYASVFSNETELPLKVAAQAFLSALDAAKFDGRTYIARLTLATQAFARAVCQSAGLKWEPALSSGRGGVAAWPAAPEKRGPASGQALNPPKRPATPPVTETRRRQPASELAPQANAPLNAEPQPADRPRSKVAAAQKAKTPLRAVRKPAASKNKPVKSKGPAPRAARKPPVAKPGIQPAGRKASKLRSAPKPATPRKPVKKPAKPKPSAASKRKA